MSLDHWTCHFHFTYMPGGCRYSEMFGHVCVTNVWQDISSLLFLFCVGFYNRFTFPDTGTSSSLMPQCLGQREQSLCSFFFSILTWKSTCPSGNATLKMDSVWVPLQLPPRPHQTPNQCQCLHVCIRVSGCFCNVKAPEWREAYLGNAVWLPNKHKQWL